MNKDITLFISSLGGGGAEKIAVNLSNALSTLGWDVTLMVLSLKNEKYLKDVSNDVTIINLSVDRALKSFLPLAAHMLKNRPSKVLVFNYELMVVMVLLRSLLNVRFKLLGRNINNYSSAIPVNSIRSLLYKFIIDKFYYRGDFYINQCQSMENDLLHNFPCLRGKTCYIYNPVTKTSRSLKTSGSTSNQKYFLCVGRLERQKGIDRAMEIFSQFSLLHPSFRLKIVGDGSLRGELSALAKKLNIDHLVDFVGYIGDVKEIYANAVATILTSHYEGFPNVLIESLAEGTPVVSYDCLTGPSEIIFSGVNGFLIDSDDVQSFVSALEKCTTVKFDVSVGMSRFDSANVFRKYSEVLSSL